MSHVYLSGAYLLDPFYELHNSGADTNLYRMSDIAPDQFSRNQYFLEYYQRTTIIDEIAFIIWPSPQMSVHVCLGRDVKSKRRFTIREISSTKQVLPIVETLVCEHWGNLRFNREDHGENVLERMVRLVAETHSINLTKRQAEVALLVLRGHSSASIGLRLDISPQTVKVFRKQLYRKCNISSQAELFALITPLLVN
jgi:DNA-binding CsgD family transcriptional regulator